MKEDRYDPKEGEKAQVFLVAALKYTRVGLQTLPSHPQGLPSIQCDLSILRRGNQGLRAAGHVASW